MFPEFNKSHSAEEIFWFNGFDDVPVYRKMEVVEPGYEHLVNIIRTAQHQACGFIEGKFVNYHLCDSASYFIDMDKDFVFAYFSGVSFDDKFPVMLIFDFLKFKAGKFLLVFDDTYFLLEKTEATYKICVELDKIFGSMSFFHNIFMKAIGENNYEEIFYKLLEVFSMKFMNKDVRCYKPLDLLMKVLKLDIS